MIGSDCAVIARRASRELGIDIDLAVTREPVSVLELSPAERSALDAITTRQRALSWLRGRAALKALIGELGDTDTARIQFPSRRFSLTHSGDLAVAAGCRRGRAAGLGVDLEWDRPAPSAAARFYLSSAETDWALAQQDPSKQLLRLWTIKEALFKADPDNDQTVLSDYELMSPKSYGGVCTAGRVDLRYLCVRLEGGFMSFAVAEETRPDARNPR